MSQFLHSGPGFYFMTKKGNFLSICFIYFSRFHKIKTRAYMKNLSHSSLCIGMK